MAVPSVNLEGPDERRSHDRFQNDAAKPSDASHPFLALMSFTGPLLAPARAPTPLNAFEGISVPNAERTDVSRFTDAGVVTVESGNGIIVTVAGELKSRAERDGAVGVLLLPVIPFFDSLFRSRRILLSVAEFIAPIAAGEAGYFLSKPKRIDSGFPRYRLLLFNTTGATVSANVYVYASRL